MSFRAFFVGLFCAMVAGALLMTNEYAGALTLSLIALGFWIASAGDHIVEQLKPKKD